MKLINSLAFAAIIATTVACNSQSNTAENTGDTAQESIVDSVSNQQILEADITDTIVTESVATEESSLSDLIKNLKPIKYPNDIRAYVDVIIADGQHLICTYRDQKDEYKKAVQDVADKLQAYKNGTRRYFPKEELDKVLSMLMNSIGYVESHAGYLVTKDIEIFPRLLQLAANVCPDINMMAAHTSTDKNMGIISINPANTGGYNFNAVISKADNGYKIQFLPDYNDAINRLRLIEGTDNPKKYLLSTEDNALLSYPCIAEYAQNGNVTIRELEQNFNLGEWNEKTTQNDKKLYFNPKELSWSWCYAKENGYLEKIPGSETVSIDLNTSKITLK
ncbi:MAG: hypothetical protein IKZ14_08695 [Muribaculaceae bacterium]|nr:hypothetical protein [Muribaculaceae bacterium]